MDEQPEEAAAEAGSGTVSRRAVMGATLGGLGSAGLVGVVAATSWPKTTTEVVNAAGTPAGEAGSTGEKASTGKGAEIDAAAEPKKSWKARDPKLAPAPAATEHKITITAKEGVAEIAPGTTQELWTFDDLMPGPVYRGKLGDQFRFTLKNEGKVDHSIDFHASKVAWSGPMQSIKPGGSVQYDFEAKHAGIFMYHCGTPPVLHHIGNGMHGVVIIDPPDLAKVDHEFFMVQSEMYLGPEGKPGDLAKMQREEWDAVVFNGYHSQYKHRPIRVEPDQRIRVWVHNVGPSENCAFHVIGTIFDTAYKEGSYRLRPDGGRGGCQALDLQACQGGFVEFTFDEPGFYPFVTHKFSNPGKGAIGLFQAGDVEPPAGGE